MLSMKFTFIAVLFLIFSSIIIGADAADCNEDITASSGSIISSGFPKRYENDLDCYYTITTPTRTSIFIGIKYLELEDPGDYIQIYDGPTTDSTLLGQFTGNIKNSTIYTSSNKAMIYFHTDNNVTDTGFYVYYYSEDIPEGSCPDEYYGGDSGEISSPNYPNAYTINADCIYRISTPSDTQIKLHFESFDILEYYKCNADYVEIFDGPSESSTSIGKFCGPGPISDVFCSTNETYAVFHSGSGNVDHLGFHITYSIEACSEPKLISGDSGTVRSPGYPMSNYPNNADCSYIVTTPVGSRVFLRVDYVNMEYGWGDCRYDSVTIYDGELDTDPILGTVCDTGPYEDMLGSYNKVLIKFHSDYTNAYPGFSITYGSTYVQLVEETKPTKNKEAE